MNEAIGEYLEVELFEEGEKTNIYLVLNRKWNCALGKIKWNGNWRQYCFFPENAIVFSVGCMQDICKFISKLMEERKRDEKIKGHPHTGSTNDKKHLCHTMLCDHPSHSNRKEQQKREK